MNAWEAFKFWLGFFSVILTLGFLAGTLDSFINNGGRWSGYCIMGTVIFAFLSWWCFRED